MLMMMTIMIKLILQRSLDAFQGDINNERSDASANSKDATAEFNKEFNEDRRNQDNDEGK